MENSKITINVESIGADSIQAKFTGGAKNFNELISLGGAILQTFLNSATEIIKRNDDELDMPNEILQLTILDALVDKVCNLVQTEQKDNSANAKVDEFLDNIINGLKRGED